MPNQFDNLGLSQRLYDPLEIYDYTGILNATRQWIVENPKVPDLAKAFFYQRAREEVVRRAQQQHAWGGMTGNQLPLDQNQTEITQGGDKVLQQQPYNEPGMIFQMPSVVANPHYGNDWSLIDPNDPALANALFSPNPPRWL